MKIQWSFLLLALIFASCSSTLLIKNDDSSLKELNKKLEGEEVTVGLLSGDEVSGENVVVKPDSTTIRRG